VSQDARGKISATKKTVAIDSTYSSTGTNPVNGKAGAAALGTLDVSNISGFGAGKTLATLTETDGKIAATFQNISITKSQVSDFAHTHETTVTTSEGTSHLTLLPSQKYSITAGGTSFVFTTPTDTTYESKAAVSGGTAVSLVTTGEKYSWNHKQDALTEMTSQEVSDLIAAFAS
jgi:hypothetical protein